MKIQDIIGQIEHAEGRVSHKYLFSLLNDGLDEIAEKTRNNTQSATTKLVKNQRWTTLDVSNVIDVYRVEIKDSDGKYRQIPRLVGEIPIGDES
tara:strand:+ start:1689 stop:1970 length:282 start_codon:yes stop_codon:yes gene_type:complete